ncbi:MAG: FtsQ-type POTRA domain-containing protein, partial [Lentisphaeria bacterium]|nr:FtsQ-type POTRA domain-containing protein [Lentisphaeria bacterium]
MKSKKEKKSENKSKTTVDFKTKLAVFLTLAIIVIGGIVFGSVFLYHQIFTENPRFNLSKLIVESNGYWNNKNNELLRLTDLKLHKDNIWKLSLSSLRKKVLLLPGVENCDVIRVIPDTIQFIITERIPRAQLAEFRAVMVDSDTYALLAQIIFYCFTEVSEMGAAQQQGTDALLTQRLKTFRNAALHRRVVGVAVAALYKLHKGLAGQGDDPLLRSELSYPALENAALYAGAGGDDAQRAAALHCHHGPDAGVHHVENRQMEGGEHIGGGAGHGAAGGNNGLGAAVAEKLHILQGHLAKLLHGLCAVGHPCGVTEVYYVFIGQQLPQREHRGKAAQTGVKNADG